MARCDQGYLCDICGEEVESIQDSELYLRYVIGEIPLEVLHTAPERHLRCHPTFSQFIVDVSFQPPCSIEGVFDKRNLDPAFVSEREVLVTKGYRRLIELQNQPEAINITRYPLRYN